MKKSIVCSTCGSTMLIAAHMAASVAYAHIDPDHDFVVDKAKRLAQMSELPVVGVESKKKPSKENLPKEVLTLFGIVPDEIELPFVEFERILIPVKLKEKHIFPKHRISNFHSQKVIGRLGQKNIYHIRQPRSK